MLNKKDVKQRRCFYEMGWKWFHKCPWNSVKMYKGEMGCTLHGTQVYQSCARMRLEDDRGGGGVRGMESGEDGKEERLSGTIMSAKINRLSSWEIGF